MVPRRPDEQAICKAVGEIRCPQERAAYLDRACGGDAGLRKRVEELLRCCEERRGGASPAPECGRTSSSEPSVPCSVSSAPALVPAPDVEACLQDGEALAEARTVSPGAEPGGPSSRHVRVHWGASVSPGISPHTTIKRVSGHGGGAPRIVVKPRVVSEDPRPSGGLADYQLLARIGEGGMGIVYAARQTAMDRQIALKVLKPGLAKNERDRMRFLSEAGVTGDLDHPNIVPVHDLGSDESGALFYAMKHVRGEPWRKSIRHRSLAENLDILLRVADAVAFAHSRGVIHRDLKPENVMLGDFGEVLVMDWGLAASVTGDGKALSVLESGVQGGTPAYMPPEVARGAVAKIGTASDMYLLGAILYEIVTGRWPHSGKSAMDCILNAAANKVPQIEQPGELDEIALKALSTDPADRYATVKEFQAAIRDCQEHSESLLLSSAASGRLARLSAVPEADRYRECTEIIAGQQQALNLWEDNGPAVRGLRAAREAYIELALKRGDLALAESQVRAIGADRVQYVVEGKQLPEPIELTSRVAAAVAEARRKERIGRVSRRLALGAGVLVLLVTAAAYVVTKSERDKARLAQAEEARQRAAAVAALRRAEREDYYNVIALADSKIAGSEFARAEDLLWDTPSELRGWEWGRLMYLCHPDMLTLEQDSPVMCAEFSPDGSRLATGGVAGAKLWDAQTGREVAALGQDASSVPSVAFSPDGTRVATCHPDGACRIWSVEDGTELAVLTGPSRLLTSGFSPDGRRLVTGSLDGIARIWNADGTGDPLMLGGHTRGVGSASFSPDGRRVVTGSFDGTAKIWDAETGREMMTFARHSRSVDCAVFSPDGRRVVTSGEDGVLRTWDAENGTWLAMIGGPSGSGGHVAFSPDGTRLVSTSGDRAARIWDVKTGLQMRELKGHRGAVHWAAFSPNGDRIVTAGDDGTARIWDAAADRAAMVLGGGSSGASASFAFARFFPDGQRVLTGDRQRAARIWDVERGLELLSLGPQVRGSRSGDASPDGRRIVAPTGSAATVWDAETGDELMTLDGHPPACNSAAFSSDASRIVTAGNDGTVRIWDARDGRELVTLDISADRLVFAAFLRGTKEVITVDGDGTLRINDAQTGQGVLVLRQEDGDIVSACLSPDGGQLVTAGRDRVARVWDLHTGLQLLVLEGDSSCAVFGPTGRRLVTGGGDGNIRVWDAVNGQELLAFHGDERAVNCVDFSPDGRSMVTAGRDGTAKVWKALDWTLPRAELDRQLDGEKRRDYAIWLRCHGPGNVRQRPVSPSAARQ